MSKITILGVYGFEHAIRAMRLPMKSLNKSDSFALTKEEVSHLEEIRLSGDFDKLNKVLPQSYLQIRIVKCSYEALRAMHHDRKDHKLTEWRNFCRVLKALPNSWMIVE